MDNDPHHLRVIKETESSTTDVTENEIEPQCTGHDVSADDDNITGTAETELRPAGHVVYNESSVAVGENCLQQETQITLGAFKIAMEPFHPPSTKYPRQTITSETTKKVKTLVFQSSWYDTFSWLHYTDGIDGVICFACFRAKAENVYKAEDVHEDPAFVMRGFKN